MVGEDGLRNPDLVREMEARGSLVSKARLIRRVSTACVIDELLKEFVSLFSEVTTRFVRERHEVVAHGEAGIVPVAVLLDGTSVGGVPSGGSTACHGVVAGRGHGVGPNVEQHLLIAYLGADVRSLARPQNQIPVL